MQTYNEDSIGCRSFLIASIRSDIPFTDDKGHDKEETHVLFDIQSVEGKLVETKEGQQRKPLRLRLFRRPQYLVVTNYRLRTKPDQLIGNAKAPHLAQTG